MKRLIIFLSSLLLAAGNSYGRELTANFSWCAFSTPDNKNYVETYLSVIGSSVNYVKNANGKFQAAVEVKITFMSDTSITAFKSYILNSPEIDDTLKPVNFLDLQRIPIGIGFYYVNVTLTDINRKPKAPIMNRRTMLMDLDPDSVSLSSVEFLESYSQSNAISALTKSGYDLVPYVSSFYPENMKQLTFYSEVYNTGKVFKPEEKFLVLYYIESAATGNRMTDYNAFAKFSPQKVNPLLYSFNISTLPSGSYHLVMEVRNGSNRLLAMRKTPFERFNPGVNYKLEDLQAMDVSNTFVGKITNSDSLIDMIRCLRPISSTSEIEYAENRIKAGDVKLMQNYIYNFWMARNQANPEGEWKKYELEVKKVNAEFGTQIMKGYETDRGRVYLQYGPPDQRVVETSEPSSYPYEIWQYYTIRPGTNISVINQPNNSTQTNKKFVFADFDLVTNNYTLIHSDARGETRDDNWKVRLVRRDRTNGNLDNSDTNPQYGGHSDDWYKDPH